MEGIIYLGSATAGLVYFVLGVRLVRLGIRTRSAAEWLLGLSFLMWAFPSTVQASSGCAAGAAPAIQRW